MATATFYKDGDTRLPHQTSPLKIMKKINKDAGHIRLFGTGFPSILGFIIMFVLVDGLGCDTYKPFSMKAPLVVRTVCVAYDYLQDDLACSWYAGRTNNGSSA